MLQALRTGSQSRAAKVLFILLLLSFALWGMGPVFSGSRVHTAAEAGGVSISTTALDEAYRREVRSIEKKFGLQITPEMAAKLNIKYQLAQQMVMQSLFDQEAARLGLRLDMDMIKQTIASQPQVRDEKGRFSPQLFQALLQSVSMSEGEYATTLRGDLIRTILMGGVRAGASVPLEMARRLYVYDHEKRGVDALLVKASDMRPVPAPKEDDLTRFHTAHGAERYMAPEFRKLSYVVIDPAKLADGTAVTDEEVRKAYDDSPADYAEPERRDVVQVTTADKALAAKIAAEAASKSLQEVAKANNVMAHPVTGVARGDVLPVLSDILFRMEPNKPSAAVESPMGWHVMVVTQVHPARSLSFEEAKPQVVERLKSQKVQEKSEEQVRALEDALAGGATVAETAQKLNLPVVRLEAVSAFGLRPDNSEVTGQPLLPEVLKAAFTLRDGESSPVQQTERGLFAVKVEGVTPSHVKPLADVRMDVIKGWTDAQQADMAAKKAESMAAQLRKGETVAGLASLDAFPRDAKEPEGLTAEAVKAIFAARRGEIITSPSADGTWVLRLARIEQAPLSGVDFAPVQGSLKEDVSNDLLEQYGAALRKSYGVTLNEEWLKQAASRGE